jgi:hypothetical protein
LQSKSILILFIFHFFTTNLGYSYVKDRVESNGTLLYCFNDRFVHNSSQKSIQVVQELKSV